MVPKQRPILEEQKRDPCDPTALAYATSIDRRTCHRVVPLRVLCLGASRTGTCSLRQALIDLGYKDCYHFSALLQENPLHQHMWIEAFEAKYEKKGKPFQRSDWDQLGHCMAITDTPCRTFYRELLEAYPDAKVVLTVRDNPDQWFMSMMQTIIPFFPDFIKPPPNPIEIIFRAFRPFDKLTFRMNHLVAEHDEMYQALWYDYQNGTETAKQWYTEYIETVKQLVPPERLLIMNLKEGWRPLCEFLGEDVPGYPFPRRNDTITFQKNMSQLAGGMDAVAGWNIAKTVGASIVCIGAVAITMFDRMAQTDSS